jgi:hypothetical protein
MVFSVIDRDPDASASFHTVVAVATYHHQRRTDAA